MFIYGRNDENKGGQVLLRLRVLRSWRLSYAEIKEQVNHYTQDS